MRIELDPEDRGALKDAARARLRERIYEGEGGDSEAEAIWSVIASMNEGDAVDVIFDDFGLILELLSDAKIQCEITVEDEGN